MEQQTARSLMRASFPKKPKRAEPQKHEWFDGWMVAKGEGLRALVLAILRSVDHHEQHTKARVRARKPADEVAHRRRIEAVVCHLARAVLFPPPTGRVAVRLGHGEKGRTRYDSPAFGKTLSPLLNTLETLDFLDVDWRHETLRGEVSTMAPSAWFARKGDEFGVTLSDFGRDEAEEVVILNRKVRGNDETTAIRTLVDYQDTPETVCFREAVRALNVFLSAADITFLDDGEEPRVDPFDRTMRRYFVIREGQEVRFDQSGRLFGGFWHPLRSERRRHIRIGGEPVAVLDYSSMFTRLAYAEIAAEPPEGDLYAIPGLEGYRSGVKMAMNCFLFDGGPRRKWPSDMGIGVGDDLTASANTEGETTSFRGRLPEGWTVGRTRKAILDVHPALAKAWNRQLGFRLMFLESQIILAVLEDLASQGIPALGLHDGLIVAQSKHDVARTVMTEKAKDLTGCILPVSMKV